MSYREYAARCGATASLITKYDYDKTVEQLRCDLEPGHDGDHSQNVADGMVWKWPDLTDAGRP
jgi:hypothetical protein